MTGGSHRHSQTARAVLRSLVPVVCPPEAAPLAEPIIDHMALQLGVIPPLLRHGFAAGIIAYDLGALAGYRKRARSLIGEAAERYFVSWEDGPSPRASLARTINQLMSLACYEQPAMMERVGYRPKGWIAEVTRRRLDVYRDDVAHQAAQIIAPDPLRPPSLPPGQKAKPTA